jgi:uracil-DNA glycosylase family 4
MMAKKTLKTKKEDLSLTEVNLITLAKNAIDMNGGPAFTKEFAKDVIWFIVNKIYSDCSRCQSEAAYKMGQPLMGTGNKDADIFIIGEAPSEEQSQLKQEFVGTIGLLMQAALEAYDLSRSEDVYITKAIICKPTEINDSKSEIYRSPKPSEVENCRSRLLAEIALVQPKAIIAMGNFAHSALKGEEIPTEDHGVIEGELEYSNWKGEKQSARYYVVSSIWNILSSDKKIKDDTEAVLGWAICQAKAIVFPEKDKSQFLFNLQSNANKN